jgi:hypothetical protein
MGIDYQIDDERRLVLAQGRGVVTPAQVFAYQREVWSRPEVAGYNELFDMSEAERLVPPSKGSVRDLAELASGMDATGCASKFAIVAPEDLAFGIARMYESYREFDPRSTKAVAVFRSLGAALRWLESKKMFHGAGRMVLGWPTFCVYTRQHPGRRTDPQLARVIGRSAIAECVKEYWRRIKTV